MRDPPLVALSALALLAMTLGLAVTIREGEAFWTAITAAAVVGLGVALLVAWVQRRGR
jgi:hypothetical protein